MKYLIDSSPQEVSGWMRRGTMVFFYKRSNPYDSDAHRCDCEWENTTNPKDSNVYNAALPTTNIDPERVEDYAE